MSKTLRALYNPALLACFQELVEWLDDNNFVKALFAGHTQLIRRSGDVVGFLCRERALTAGHVDIIWAAGGGGQDKDRRICVHEVLGIFLTILSEQRAVLLSLCCCGF